MLVASGTVRKGLARRSDEATLRHFLIKPEGYTSSKLLHCTLVANGTKRTSSNVAFMSAFG